MAKYKTCLLIDDDLDDHEIFSMALEDLNRPVKLISEYNPISALSRLKRSDEAPDIIFLDLNMPRMNGKQCLGEIRKFPHLREIPVIVYSTSSEIRDLIDTRELGATAYIVKSSRISDLTAALKDFFGEI
jgi:CheY-like chemotaxis protein